MVTVDVVLHIVPEQVLLLLGGRLRQPLRLVERRAEPGVHHRFDRAEVRTGLGGAGLSGEVVGGDVVAEGRQCDPHSERAAVVGGALLLPAVVEDLFTGLGLGLGGDRRRGGGCTG